LRRNFDHADRGRNTVEGDAMAKSKKRNVFGELMDGVRTIRAHREGRITLRSHHIPALAVAAG
jgi:hypothetical protein